MLSAEIEFVSASRWPYNDICSIVHEVLADNAKKKKKKFDVLLHFSSNEKFACFCAEYLNLQMAWVESVVRSGTCLLDKFFSKYSGFPLS